MKTNVGKAFLELVDKHFGTNGNTLKQIFNRNTTKVSYSCMPNLDQILKGHNNTILFPRTRGEQSHGCNCRNKANCPLQGNCLAKNIVYLAEVHTHTTPQEEGDGGTRQEIREIRRTRRTVANNEGGNNSTNDDSRGNSNNSNKNVNNRINNNEINKR